MSRKRRRNFSREFKLEAVKLITHKGYSIAEASRSLGIDYSVLRRWKNQFEKDPQHAFPGKGQLKPADEEIWRLRKQLEQVTEERDILKKALAYFAEPQK
jgi:transposase